MRQVDFEYIRRHASAGGKKKNREESNSVRGKYKIKLVRGRKGRSRRGGHIQRTAYEGASSRE